MKIVSVSLLGLVASSIGYGQASTTWTGSINLAAALTISNRNSTDFFLTADASRRMGPGTFRFDGYYSYHTTEREVGGGSSTTEDRGSLQGRYDWWLSDSLFAYGLTRFDRDKIQELDLRWILGAGVGRYLARSADVKETGKYDRKGATEWKASVGLSYINEEFSGGLGSNTIFGIQFGSNYATMITKNLKLTHDAFIVPAFSDFSDYFLSSILAVSTQLSGRAKLTASWYFDYDATPAAGTRSDNQKWALSVGYGF